MLIIIVLMDVTTSINNIKVKDKRKRKLNLMSMYQPDQLIILRLQIKDEDLSPSFHGTIMHQLLSLLLHKNEEVYSKEF